MKKENLCKLSWGHGHFESTSSSSATTSMTSSMTDQKVEIFSRN